MISRDVEFTSTGPNQLSAAAPGFPTLTFCMYTMREETQGPSRIHEDYDPAKRISYKCPAVARSVSSPKPYWGFVWPVSIFWLGRIEWSGGEVEHCVCNTKEEALQWIASAKKTF